MINNNKVINNNNNNVYRTFFLFQLSKDDIETMRDAGVEGSKIIGELIENSASFSQKTRWGAIH